MLEALVSVLVTCLIGAGLASVAGGVLNQRYNAKVEHQALQQMRAQLQRSGVGLCAGPGQFPIQLTAGTDVDVKVACDTTPAARQKLLSVAGGPALAVTVPPQVRLTVPTVALAIKGADDADAPLTLSTQQ